VSCPFLYVQGINWALLRNEPPPYIPRRQSKANSTEVAAQ
jgi:hypothetical protein